MQQQIFFQYLRFYYLQFLHFFDQQEANLYIFRMFRIDHTLSLLLNRILLTQLYHPT